MHRPIKHLLDQIEPGFRLLPEHLLINTPVLELHFKHLWILFLLLVHQATISEKVYHQIKSKRVTINKNFIILFLQLVPSREQGL